MAMWNNVALSLTLLAIALNGVGVAAGDGMEVIDQDTWVSLGIENSDDIWLIELCVPCPFGIPRRVSIVPGCACTTLLP